MDGLAPERVFAMVVDSVSPKLPLVESLVGLQLVYWLVELLQVEDLVELALVY